jgi:hypothetical protein
VRFTDSVDGYCCGCVQGRFSLQSHFQMRLLMCKVLHKSFGFHSSCEGYCLNGGGTI